jgi:alpha-mannosidase
VTYSLFVHEGGWREGGVAKEALALNCPPRVLPVPAAGKNLSFSLFTLDAANVHAETVKRAQDGDGIIVRLFENWGRYTKTRMQLDGSFPQSGAHEPAGRK